MTTCDDVRSVAAELALGLLTGPERGEVLAHLDACPSCRRDADALAAASDRVLQLAPEAEPPPGFETRVLRRIVTPVPVVGPRPHHGIRRVVGAAAAVLLVVAGFGIAAVLEDDGPLTRGVSSVPMLTADGQVAGELYLHEGDPSWVFLTAPSWSHWGDETGEVYVLEAVLTDGQEVELGRPTLDAGSGAWGTATTIDVGHIHGVALIDDDGHVWCSATVA